MTALPLNKRINYRLNQISRNWSALVVAMARSKYKLNPDAIKTLSVIAHYQPLSPTDLMERTSSDSPKVARALRVLTEEGLVERQADPNDGRRAMITTTSKGTKVNGEVEELSNTVEQMVLAALDEAEVRSLYTILDKVEDVVRQRLGGSTWNQLEAQAREARPKAKPKPRPKSGPKAKA